jgi:hypothetical protein
MHEVTAHPDTPNMIRLFVPHLGPDYDPILTPGTLPAREDWVEIVAAAKESGARSARRAACLTVRRPSPTPPARRES